MRNSWKKYVTLGAALLILATSTSRAFAERDGDPQATVEALQTQVATLSEENEALQTQVAAFSTPTPLPERTPVVVDPIEIADGLVVLSYRFINSGMYRADNPEKGTWVVGEMQNVTDQTLDAPGIGFVLTDDGGNIIGQITADPILSVILPGQVMPFESSIYGDEPAPSEWTKEIISVCGNWGASNWVTAYDPSTLQLVDVTEERHEDGVFIEGKVQNNGVAPASGVWIAAAVYNAADEFTGWFWTFLQVDVPVDKFAKFEFNSLGNPQDPVGVAGTGYKYQLWVGFNGSAGSC